MNPEHELATRRILAEELPELADDITISCEALPLHREYERTSTTVMNAYLTPLVREYFRRLSAELEESKLYAWLQMMQSNGGLVRPERAASFPILTLLSGPAGGSDGLGLPGGVAGRDPSAHPRHGRDQL